MALSRRRAESNILVWSWEGQVAIRGGAPFDQAALVHHRHFITDGKRQEVMGRRRPILLLTILTRVAMTSAW